MGGAAAETLIGKGVGALLTETISRESGARRFSRFVLCLYFALSIFEPYLNGIFGSVTKYYIFFVIFVLIYESRGTIWVRRYSAFYVVWFLYKVFTLLWSRSLATPKLHMISQIGMVLFLVVLYSYEHDEKTLRRVEVVYWLSSAAVGLMSIFFSRSYRGVADARQVLVVAGVEIDPNNQAALLLVGIAISLVYLFYYRRFMVPAAAILLVNVYASFLTGSRGSLITLAALIVICILLPERKGSIGGKLWKLLALAVFAVVAVLLAQKYMSHAGYQRLFEFESYEGGSGRVHMWRNVLRSYLQNPFTILFGIGWGSATVLTGSNVAMHNTFLTLLCDVGLIGTVVFLWPVASMSLKLIRERNMFPVLLLAAQMIPSFFIDAINKRFFWNAIFLLGMYYFTLVRTRREAQYAAELALAVTDADERSG